MPIEATFYMPSGNAIEQCHLQGVQSMSAVASELGLVEVEGGETGQAGQVQS